MGDRRRPRDPGQGDRRPRAHVGIRSRLRVRPRRRDRDDHRRPGCRRSRRSTRCSCFVKLVCEQRPDARLALPVSVSRRPSGSARRNGAPITWTKLSASHLMEIAGSGRVDFAASQEGGFIWPAFLPAYDAVATLVHLLDLLASSGPLAVVDRGRGPRDVRRPRRRADTVGTQGNGDARRHGTGQGLPDGARRRREDRLSATVGRSCCPTPSSRSRTSGPRARATSRRAVSSRSTPVRSPSSPASSGPSAPSYARHGRACEQFPKDLP